MMNSGKQLLIYLSSPASKEQPFVEEYGDLIEEDKSANRICPDDIVEKGSQRQESTHVDDMPEHKELSGTHALETQVERPNVATGHLANIELPLRRKPQFEAAVAPATERHAGGNHVEDPPMPSDQVMLE